MVAMGSYVAVWLPWDPRWPYGCHGILGGRMVAMGS